MPQSEGGRAMKSNELSGKTVSELKALAKKRKVAVPADAKKTDIIRALGRSGSPGGTANKTVKEPAQAKKKTAVSAKAKARTKATAKKTVQAEARARSLSAAPASAVRAKSAAGKRSAMRTKAADREMLAAQDRIEDAKYFTGPEEQRPHGLQRLPEEYGEERIMLMARDPDTVFAYWEVPFKRLERERARSGKGGRLCVRLYDITGVRFDGTNATSIFDQEMHERVGSWYFDLHRPSHAFCADIGMRMPDGRFRTIARSNILVTPRAGVSDVVEEEWTLPERQLLELYGISADVAGGVSSELLQELLRRRRGLEITSPGVFSPGWQGRGQE